MAVHSPLLNGTPRLPSRQGAILVPNSRLVRGNGLYLSLHCNHQQSSGAVWKSRWPSCLRVVCPVAKGQRSLYFSNGLGTKHWPTEHEQVTSSVVMTQRTRSWYELLKINSWCYLFSQCKTGFTSVVWRVSDCVLFWIQLRSVFSAISLPYIFRKRT